MQRDSIRAADGLIHKITQHPQTRESKSETPPLISGPSNTPHLWKNNSKILRYCTWQRFMCEWPAVLQMCVLPVSQHKAMYAALPWDKVVTSLGMLGRPFPAQPYAPTLTRWGVPGFRSPITTSYKSQESRRQEHCETCSVWLGTALCAGIHGS